ncbi:MAG: hypothetical protein CXT73_05350 [Methanobacteriota archaeon]|nr:MAG: hypothetical protein CXT73_05350 [Euryarchaeota archaeon]
MAAAFRTTDSDLPRFKISFSNSIMKGSGLNKTAAERMALRPTHKLFFEIVKQIIEHPFYPHGSGDPPIRYIINTQFQQEVEISDRKTGWKQRQDELNQDMNEETMSALNYPTAVRKVGRRNGTMYEWLLLHIMLPYKENGFKRTPPDYMKTRVNWLATIYGGEMMREAFKYIQRYAERKLLSRPISVDDVLDGRESLREYTTSRWIFHLPPIYLSYRQEEMRGVPVAFSTEGLSGFGTLPGQIDMFPNNPNVSSFGRDGMGRRMQPNHQRLLAFQELIPFPMLPEATAQLTDYEPEPTPDTCIGKACKNIQRFGKNVKRKLFTRKRDRQRRGSEMPLISTQGLVRERRLSDIANYGAAGQGGKRRTRKKTRRKRKTKKNRRKSRKKKKTRRKRR